MHIRLKTFLLLVSPLLLAVAAAYIQWGTVGLPALPPSPLSAPESTMEPYGFAAWLRITHYVNFLFLILLIRSDLQILMRGCRRECVRQLDGMETDHEYFGELANI